MTTLVIAACPKCLYNQLPLPATTPHLPGGRRTCAVTCRAPPPRTRTSPRGPGCRVSEAASPPRLPAEDESQTNRPCQSWRTTTGGNTSNVGRQGHGNDVRLQVRAMQYLRCELIALLCPTLAVVPLGPLRHPCPQHRLVRLHDPQPTPHLLTKRQGLSVSAWLLLHPLVVADGSIMMVTRHAWGRAWCEAHPASAAGMAAKSPSALVTPISRSNGSMARLDW